MGKDPAFHFTPVVRTSIEILLGKNYPDNMQLSLHSSMLPFLACRISRVGRCWYLLQSVRWFSQGGRL